jgi:hypothetical protein
MVVAFLSISCWLTIKKKPTKKYIRLYEGLKIFVHICEYIDRKTKEIDILYWLIWKWRQKKRNEQINKRYKMIEYYVAIDNDTFSFASFVSSVTLYWLEHRTIYRFNILDMKTESFTPYTIIITMRNNISNIYMYRRHKTHYHRWLVMIIIWYLYLHRLQYYYYYYYLPMSINFVPRRKSLSIIDMMVTFETKNSLKNKSQWSIASYVKSNMMIIVVLLSISSFVTSRTLIETTNSTDDNEYFHFSKSYISSHRLIFAKLILLFLLGCFFWICSCHLIIRQIYADKQRTKSSTNTHGNISTIPIEQT